MSRRLAAIVAADVVGYSELLSTDEISTLVKFNVIQGKIIDPLLTKYNGHKIRLMGDGSLLEFKSAQDATGFAIEVQKELAEFNKGASNGRLFQFRIGIDLGDVVTEAGDVHGDCANIAARLQTLAQPGELCLSDNIYSITKTKLGEKFNSSGPIELKNISDPVTVWRWRPEGDLAALTNEQVQAASGRQVLPKSITDLFLELHMLSVRAVLSVAFDEILSEPGGGKAISMEEIYERLGEGINRCRSMLNVVNIERVEEQGEFMSDDIQTQPMGQFISSVFNNSRNKSAMILVPQIQGIFHSDAMDLEKRAKLMELAVKFMNENTLPKCKALVKFGYVEV